MKKTTKILIPAVIIVGAFVLMKVLTGMKKESPKNTPTEQVKIVETAVVKMQDTFAEVTAYGKAKTADPIALYAEAVGTIEEGRVPFKQSQRFNKGDLLLMIDDRQTRYSLNSAKSDFITALATVLPEIKIDFPQLYPKWQTYFNSCDFNTNIKPLPESDNEKVKLYLARFNVYKLYYTVKNLEVQLGKHFIYAPFDGSIIRTNLSVGSSARSGTLLGEIISLEDMEIAVPLELNNVSWVDESKEVNLYSKEFDANWEGKITRVGSTIDGSTQTVSLYISINDSKTANLLDNIFVRADLPGKVIPNSYSVPSRAVYENKYVYVIEEGKLARKDIEIVRKEPNRIIVRGLNDADVLVTEAMQGVAPGMNAESKALYDDRRSS